MKFAPVVSCFVAGLTVLLAACAPQTEVVKLYESAAASGKQFDRILVVTIAADADTRRRSETLISEKLRGDRVTAVPAYTETGNKPTLLQQEINDAAQRSAADAILITHFVSVDTEANVEEGRVDVIPECRGGDPADYFLYDYEMLKEPDTVRLALTVVAVTSLYDAETSERVWTVQSTCFKKASMDEVLLDEAIAISRQLRIDRLIR
ncbi:MAG: hypothetical protein KJO19_08300 [Woeseia sp.]|nr:hypothetical protein [Woeseia sp.]MBT8097026.1 hypothetical protein [Woeseia sp.]